MQLAAAIAGSLAALALPSLMPSLAGAHHFQAPLAQTALTPTGCPGASIEPSRVITGEFDSSLEGSYILIPFEVPKKTTAVRVKYCYDQPENSTSVRHTLDLGLYEARHAPGSLFGEKEFRGWGGSSHPDVTVSPEGFSTEAQYLADPRGHVPGKTTRGFLPGRIPAGEWAVELGAGAIIPQSLGDADGKVAWRVEIELSRNPSYADEPYRPARYDKHPARRKAGWYEGDFHVHAEHSALGDATMTETFDYAFRSQARGGAGLDFITLSDYVAGSAWGEIGRYQDRYPRNLIVRSDEVITYRGHANNHASVTFVDYRTGPVYERATDGTLTLERSHLPPSEIFEDVHKAGGFTQLNHTTIFPSSNPVFRQLCRGCPWDYSDAETDYSKVDAIEVSTGPPPPRNPFTDAAIAFWEHALDLGHKIAAVGSSDSHNAGRTTNPFQSPIGIARTVVRATKLSERGLQDAVEAGHTYVKIPGDAAPDVRFEARSPRHKGPAIMGDTIHAGQADFVAKVLGATVDPSDPNPYRLIVLKDGTPIRTEPVTSAHFTLRFRSTGHGRYRLQVERGDIVEVVSSPIYLER